MDPGAADAQFDGVVLRDRLEKAMAKLPDRARFVLAAHYLRGARYEDVADTLGVPVGTVKTLIFRAKRQLRELMTAEGL
jgi:RNA polymerase sigma-70 factor (ECF subfamily)